MSRPNIKLSDKQIEALDALIVTVDEGDIYVHWRGEPTFSTRKFVPGKGSVADILRTALGS